MFIGWFVHTLNVKIVVFLLFLSYGNLHAMHLKKSPLYYDQKILLSDSILIEEQKKFLMLQELSGKDLFGDFLNVLGALYLYDEGAYTGVKVNLLPKETDFDPTFGPNYWEYFFDPINVGSAVGATEVETIYIDGDTVDLSCFVECNMSRVLANDLIIKYIHPKLHIEKKVRSFVDKYFGKGEVIGIHYSGSDHYSDDPAAQFKLVAEYVDGVLAEFPRGYVDALVKIFIVTDDQKFLDFMINRYRSKVTYCKDVVRSDGAHSVHDRSNVGGYKRGEEELIDCLLLSKCDVLLRTHSQLSLCSEYFNPNIPVIIMRISVGQDPLY